MENASDALKISFAVFIFILAIGIAFTLISQAKSTADIVLYHSDSSNFYEYSYSGGSEKNRKVSVSELIPTLYRYYIESIGVTINLKDGNSYMFDLNNREDIFIGKTKLNSEADREENLKEFVRTILLELPEETKFEEEFVEVPIDGIYEYGTDGTELVISSGGKKVYITYTQK